MHTQRTHLPPSRLELLPPQLLLVAVASNGLAAPATSDNMIQLQCSGAFSRWPDGVLPVSFIKVGEKIRLLEGQRRQNTLRRCLSSLGPGHNAQPLLSSKRQKTVMTADHPPPITVTYHRRQTVPPPPKARHPRCSKCVESRNVEEASEAGRKRPGVQELVWREPPKSRTRSASCASY
jgi:hypothetical protein